MLRFLLKIWPAFIPIALYLIWALLIKRYFKKKPAKERIIDAEFETVENSNKENSSQLFSLQNKFFVMIVYASLILAIISLILTAFSS